MKAVVFKDNYDVVVEERAKPGVSPDSVVVKTAYAGCCGSDLHIYRGAEPVSRKDFTMGHEIIGYIEEVGQNVDPSIKAGDAVLTPFTISCGQCEACHAGHSARCTHSRLFGCPALEGCQAEYVEVPCANGSIVHVDEVSPVMLLMSDVFPTGYTAAKRAQLLPGETVVVLGCGPVGLCAILSALQFGASKVYAVDRVASRLAFAEKIGAIPVDFTKSPIPTADAVLEVVGNEAALRTAYETVKPCGRIASVGVHNSPIPFTATEAYDKNITISFGRCSVRSVFDEAMLVFKKVRRHLDTLVDTVVPLDDAPDAYRKFEKQQITKAVFKF